MKLSTGLIMRVSMFIVLAMFASVPILKAENQELSDEISSVTTESNQVQTEVNALSSDTGELVNKFKLTNAANCPLLVVGTSASPVTVNLIPESFSVAGLQADFTLPSGFAITGITPGPVATSAGKSVQFSQVGNVWRVLLFGINQTILDPGPLFTMTISGTGTGTFPITLSNLTATDANGNGVFLCGTTGGVKR